MKFRKKRKGRKRNFKRAVKGKRKHSRRVKRYGIARGGVRM